MSKRIFFSILAIAVILGCRAADPMATSYSYEQCQGSLMPYPEPEAFVEIPDSLTPVMINHVGRHGARFPASSSHCAKLRRALAKADSAGCITPLGRQLARLVDEVMRASANQWGALDSLGMAEQRGIASRMVARYPKLMADAEVMAISSYSPRCMMSMYSFTHQMDRLNNHIEFYTGTGRAYNQLLRPFDVDADYIELRKSDVLTAPYDEYFASNCPVSAIERALGGGYPYASDAEKRDLAITEYYVIAGLSAMSMLFAPEAYFTQPEFNELWSCFNLRQYLQRTATTLSTVPAEIAADLLLDIIKSTDSFIKGEGGYAPVQLRFGHAETLMPLLSLMRLKGCYYMTNYFDTVALHWQDFNVVPMAANVQFIILKNRKGEAYVRLEHNERPVPLLPNSDEIYIPWPKARDYLMNCVPMYMRP